MTDHHRHQISSYLKSHRVKQSEASTNKVHNALSASKKTTAPTSESNESSGAQICKQVRRYLYIYEPCFDKKGACVYLHNTFYLKGPSRWKANFVLDIEKI